MKKVYGYILLFIMLLSSFLSSCSPLEELELIRNEAGEIAQFFDMPDSNAEGGYARPAVMSENSLPVIIREPHVELTEFVYNSPSRVSSVASAGSADKLYIRDDAEISRDDYQKLGYTYIALPKSRDVSDLSAILSTAEIEFKILLKPNTAPAGEVFAIEYAGFSSSDGYYINPDSGVTLYVSREKPAKTAEKGDNLVYITFDDGPSEKNTVKLLDILDTYGVKASFFTTGDALKKYPDSAKAVIERGHILGCHSVTHNYKKIYSSVDALETEVAEWEQIAQNCGITREMLGQLTFRFPGGSVSSYFDSNTGTEMKTMLESRGYYVYDWNVVTNDAVLYLAPEDMRSYDYIKETFIETLQMCLNENKNKSGAPIIILMHETVDETAELLPWMLEYLISEGYTFGNLANMGQSWTFADR